MYSPPYEGVHIKSCAIPKVVYQDRITLGLSVPIDTSDTIYVASHSWAMNSHGYLIPSMDVTDTHRWVRHARLVDILIFIPLA